MELDLLGEHKRLSYKLLTSLVTPRPIALVTTVDSDGHLNAAPFSFFNALGSKPPIVGFCPGDKEPGVPKDTARNIRLTQEFVVNLVDEDIAEPMSACSAHLPPEENELERAGLSTVDSVCVKPPRIREAPVSIECRQSTTVEIGYNRLIIGIVQRLHVRDGVLDPESFHVQPDAYRIIGRMHGPDGYCRTRDYFKIERPD